MVPASLLLFSRSALIDLALALFSCSHCFLLIPWLCSHCWDFRMFLHCLLVKPIAAYFLPFFLCLLLLLSSSLLPAFFPQDSLILLCLVYYFLFLKYSPDPRPATLQPRCPLFSQPAFRSSCFTQQITPVWWEAVTVLKLLPLLQAARGLYFSCAGGYRPSYGQVRAWHSIK